MFSALRQGNLFYILDKGETPCLKVGLVQSISSPLPKYNNTYQPFSMETTVDITVKVEDEILEFKQIPGSLSIANFGNSNVVVSETKEAMNLEVDSMLRNSLLILDSIPRHLSIIESCERILKELNPEFAKQKDLEQKIDSLENKVGNIEDKLENICSMLNQALNKN